MSKHDEVLSVYESTATELLGTGAALDALAESAHAGTFTPESDTWALFSMLAAECRRGHDAIAHLVCLLLEQQKED